MRRNRGAAHWKRASPQSSREQINPPARPGWEFWIDRGGVHRRDRPRATEQSAKLLSVSDVRGRRGRGHAADAGREPRRASGGPGGLDQKKLGTTVATNALWRQGDAAGHHARLRRRALIGDQTRPSLFALDIVKPAPLFAGVIEADERLDAAGAVLSPLEALAEALARAKAEESVAIAFLHLRRPTPSGAQASWRGGGFVHRFEFRYLPLPRFIPRAETTVVDA